MDNQYFPPEPELWTGRPDTPNESSFFQIIKFLDLSENTIETQNTQAFAILGFECDEGVKRNLGRVGAAEGPNSFRKRFAALPFHRSNFSLCDAGNIKCLDGNLENAQAGLSDAVFKLLSHGFTPIVIGGGHEVAWGHYQGIRRFIRNKNLSIVNFDAHLDMRQLLENDKGSSGTPFLQIALDAKLKAHNFNYHCLGVQKTGNTKALLETAQEYDVNCVLADEIHQDDQAALKSALHNLTTSDEFIYLTICLDVFAAGFAPGVSAVQPFGLYPWQIILSIRELLKTKKVISFDIAELCPRYDQDDCTSKLAANLVYDFIHNLQ